MVQDTRSISNLFPEKPAALPVLPEAIPEELREIPQWVVWDYLAEVDKETGELDWDKLPLRVRWPR
jgi:hypothetical protein